MNIVNIDRVPKGTRTSQSNDSFHIKYENLRHNSQRHYYVTENGDNTKKFLIYPFHPDFFIQYKISDYIPKEIIHKIIDGEILLTIDLSHDGFFFFVDSIYKYLVQKQSVPAQSILLVAGSPDLETYINLVSTSLNLPPIRYECYYYWEKVVQRSVLTEINLDTGYNNNVTRQIKNPMSIEKTSKKFIAFNRLWREHKNALLMLLYEKNLINEGYISFAKHLDWDKWFQTTVKKYSDCNELVNILHRGYEVHKLLPLIVDTRDFHSNEITYYNSSRLNTFFNDSYFSLVVETSFENNRPYFPTEKTFKAIYRKHPFIIAATSGFLHKLRSQGYKTFESIINEDYDLEANSSKRLLKIADEVERLCNLTPSEVKSFKQTAYSIVEYNHSVLMEKRNFILQVT